MLIKELFNINFNGFLYNLLFSLAIIIVGFLIGKFVSIILTKLSKNAQLDKIRSYNFIKLFITVITWSIYLLFLNIALVQLDVPTLTNWLSSILLVIPTLTGALILLVVGFTIATYLKGVIEESRIPEYKTLANIFWFFVLYIFGVFAVKTALISIDQTTVNYLIIILTAVVGAGVGYWKIKRE